MQHVTVSSDPLSRTRLMMVKIIVVVLWRCVRVRDKSRPRTKGAEHGSMTYRGSHIRPDTGPGAWTSGVGCLRPIPGPSHPGMPGTPGQFESSDFIPRQIGAHRNQQSCPWKYTRRSMGCPQNLNPSSHDSGSSQRPHTSHTGRILIDGS